MVHPSTLWYTFVHLSTLWYTDFDFDLRPFIEKKCYVTIMQSSFKLGIPFLKSNYSFIHNSVLSIPSLCKVSLKICTVWKISGSKKKNLLIKIEMKKKYNLKNLKIIKLTHRDICILILWDFFVDLASTSFQLIHFIFYRIRYICRCRIRYGCRSDLS